MAPSLTPFWVSNGAMKTALALLCLLGGLALSGVARAEPARPVDSPGIELGVRLGYMIPFGEVSGDTGNGLASLVSGGIPVILEAGYRFDAALTLGAVFQYAFLKINDNACTGNADCSGSVVRLGVQGLYHADLGKMVVPWVGLGAGYEWGNITASNAFGGTAESVSGWEFLTLQAGGDIHLGPATAIAVGPYVSFSIARYGSGSGHIGDLGFSSDFTNPAVHEWLQFGVRGTFEL
jgi:hypothetical protein